MVAVRQGMIAVRLTAEQIAVLDARARERGCNRSELVRALVAPEQALAPAQTLGEAELVALLEERARHGNVRAIELLLRRCQGHAEPAEAPESPFGEVDELARRRTA
jgi:hypothetical protein